MSKTSDRYMIKAKDYGVIALELACHDLVMKDRRIAELEAELDELRAEIIDARERNDSS